MLGLNDAISLAMGVTGTLLLSPHLFPSLLQGRLRQSCDRLFRSVEKLALGKDSCQEIPWFQRSDLLDKVTTGLGVSIFMFVGPYTAEAGDDFINILRNPPESWSSPKLAIAYFWQNLLSPKSPLSLKSLILLATAVVFFCGLRRLTEFLEVPNIKTGLSILLTGSLLLVFFGLSPFVLSFLVFCGGFVLVMTFVALLSYLMAAIVVTVLLYPFRAVVDLRYWVGTVVRVGSPITVSTTKFILGWAGFTLIVLSALSAAL